MATFIFNATFFHFEADTIKTILGNIGSTSSTGPALAISPDERLIGGGVSRNTVELYDFEPKEIVRTKKGIKQEHQYYWQDFVSALHFFPNGYRILNEIRTGDFFFGFIDRLG